MDPLTRILADAQYVQLLSFRRDGSAVATPVWVVGDGGSLAVWTARDSGKVKRIGREPAVRVAPCDSRGTTFGPTVPARARVLDEGETERVRRLLIRKYGLPARLLTAIGHWRNEPTHYAGLSITVE